MIDAVYVMIFEMAGLCIVLRLLVQRSDRWMYCHERISVEVYDYGQFSKVKSGKMGSAPGRFELSKHVEVRIRNGSGIRDPPFEIWQIQIMRTGRR